MAPPSTEAEFRAAMAELRYDGVGFQQYGPIWNLPKFHTEVLATTTSTAKNFSRRILPEMPASMRVPVRIENEE